MYVTCSIYLQFLVFTLFIWSISLYTHSDRLEALQKRVLRIILHPMTLPYNLAIAYCDLDS